MSTAQNLKVLVLPSTYPRNITDPRGIFHKDQAAAIREAGEAVTVLAPIMNQLNALPRPHLSLYRPEHRLEDRIPTYMRQFIGWFPRIPYANTLLWQLQANRLFAQYRRDQGMPDIIHCHGAINAGYVASAWKARYGIPYILTEHSSAFARGMLPKWKRSVALKAYRSANRLIAVSPAHAKDMAEVYRNEEGWTVVPNTISAEFVNPPPPVRLVNQKIFRFLAIGLLKPVKGHANLLQAFGNSFRDAKSVRLRIGGAGPELKGLKSAAERLGISDQVDFLGNLTRSTVIREMDDASAFVQPSLYETFGVALVEALARGLPVVSTRCGGPDEIVTEADGILVPPGDLCALGGAMRAMVKSYPRFDQNRIRERACGLFKPAVIGSQLAQLYRRAIEDQGVNSMPNCSD